MYKTIAIKAFNTLFRILRIPKLQNWIFLFSALSLMIGCSLEKCMNKKSKTSREYYIKPCPTDSNTKPVEPKFMRRESLGRKEVLMKHYDSNEQEKAIHFFYASNKDKISSQMLQEIIGAEGWADNLNLENHRLIALIPYVKDTDRLFEPNIIGLLLYYKDTRGDIYSKAFYRDKGSFENIPRLNMKTGFIAVNYTYAFARLLQDKYTRRITPYSLIAFDEQKNISGLKIPKHDFGKVVDEMIREKYQNK